MFFVNGIAGSYLVPRKIRLLILKCYGINIKSSRVNPKCFFGEKGYLLVKKRSSIIFFGLTDLATIEKNVGMYHPISYGE